MKRGARFAFALLAAAFFAISSASDWRTRSSPSAIRFGEDLVRQSEAEEIAKKAAANKAKAKRAPRFIEETEEDLEEIDYSGRIH